MHKSPGIYFELLAAEPGLLRPFQIGYHLLSQLPVHCADSVADFLSGKKLNSRLRRVPWIASQIDHLMPGEVFSRKVSEGKYDELKDDLTTLDLVIDHVAVHCHWQTLMPFMDLSTICALNYRQLHLPGDERVR